MSYRNAMLVNLCYVSRGTMYDRKLERFQSAKVTFLKMLAENGHCRLRYS